MMNVVVVVVVDVLEVPASKSVDADAKSGRE